MKRSILPVVLISIFILLVITPATAKNREAEYKWKTEDVLTTPTITDYKISPNGKLLAWIVKKWNLKEQKSYQELFLVSLEHKDKPVQLTRGEISVSSLQWLPGSHALSFKTDKKFKNTKPGNLWRIDIRGGEAYPLTQFKKEIGQYHWLDNENLVYISRESESLYGLEIKKRKDTSEVVEDEEHRAISRLFHHNLKTKKTKRLTQNEKPMLEFTLSPDKRWVTYSLSMSVLYEQDHKEPPRHFLLNIQNGVKREIFKEKEMTPSNIAWAHDSSGLYASMAYSTHPRYRMATVHKMYWYDLSSGETNEIHLDWDRYAGDYEVTREGFLMALPHGVYNKYAHYIKKGNNWKRVWIRGDEQKHISKLKISKNLKTMVYCWSTSSIPDRYYLAFLKGDKIIKKQQVMELQPPLSQKPLVKSEVINWIGARGDRVEGILYYPYKYKQNKKYPLIVRIHGGPNARDRDLYSGNWGSYNHLLCERGTFILKVNYHGSSGYGIEFGESIAGHYYEYEVPDIEKGVDELISRGLVDPGKLGVIGWSNGAILGTALTINSNRYKAASLGAGDVNWISDYGNCEFGVAFDNFYFGGPPWEHLEHYIKKSPLFQLHKVTTPTLIFHGSKDRAVPYEQSWEYYRALQVTGKTPVRFISFPGEPHGPQKLVHRIRKIKEELVWLDKYLFKTHKNRNEALKKGSLLEGLINNGKIADVEGWYGVKKGNSLIPETLKYKNLTIGRFEVTRAQWAEFDKKYKYTPGTGNLPVTGISFEKAREYTQWLSNLTGDSYRLPKKDEIETLYGERIGNILDYWAGYTLNFDDYKKLEEELKNFGSEPVLLKTVGSFQPKGENPVYDLGGNAAEWVEEAPKKGRACGGSAERSADKLTSISPKPEYTGFRVIKMK